MVASPAGGSTAGAGSTLGDDLTCDAASTVGEVPAAGADGDATVVSAGSDASIVRGMMALQ